MCLLWCPLDPLGPPSLGWVGGLGSPEASADFMNVPLAGLPYVVLRTTGLLHVLHVLWLGAPAWLALL